MEKKIKKLVKKYNPFHIKRGETKIKWLITPKIGKNGRKSRDFEVLGQDLAENSKLRLAVKTPISEDVNVNFNFKGDSKDNNIEVKFTKNF